MSNFKFNKIVLNIYQLLLSGLESHDSLQFFFLKCLSSLSYIYIYIYMTIYLSFLSDRIFSNVDVEYLFTIKYIFSLYIHNIKY